MADDRRDDVDDATRGFPAELDPMRPVIVSAFGRKGSGKSTFNRMLYLSWPFDKLCIDVNGDADPGPDAVPVTLPLPSRMPAPRDDGRPHNLHFRADPGSSTYFDDLDRAVGMGLYPQDRRSLVWCGEIGEFTTGAKTGPFLRRGLMQNRHYLTSFLFDGPRPIDVDKLVGAQADLVAVYDLPDPDDRQRVAKLIGYPPARFARECDETFRRGDHWFLLWVTKQHRLYRCAPLPIGAAA